jgi:hypothetical protein
MVTYFKEIRMSEACATHGKRTVVYKEFRGKRNELENLCEDNINMDLQEIA